RFAFLRGGMARLQRALGQFMLDMHTARNGYSECAPPLLVRDEALFGTGQWPKFKDDLFATSVVDRAAVREVLEAYKNTALSDEELAIAHGRIWNLVDENPLNRRWLIPTAEVSLTNSVREQIIDDLSQPIRLTALTPCFRSEAGAAGK